MSAPALTAAPSARTARSAPRRPRPRAGRAARRSPAASSSPGGPSDGVSSPSASPPAASSSDAPARPPPAPYAGPPRVVVVGGGFGGLYAALKLDALGDWPDRNPPRVTLVDRSDRFVFKPLLYELVNETAPEWEVCPKFEDLLEPTKVAFHRGRVADVRPDPPEGPPRTLPIPSDAGGPSSAAAFSSAGGVVVTDDGAELAYDYLIVGVGTASSSSLVPGAKDHALPLSTFEDAQRLAGALRDLESESRRVDGAFKAPRVAVVGGGLSGAELAGVVADRLRAADGEATVELFAGRGGVMPGSPAGQRDAAERRLAEAGVVARRGCVVSKVSAAAEPNRRVPTRATLVWTETEERSESGSKATPEDAREEERLGAYDLVCWTVGQRVEAPESWPFVRDARTRKIAVEKTLRAEGHARVFCLGDVAHVRGDERSNVSAGASASESESESESASVVGGFADFAYDAAPPPAAPLPSTAQVAFQQADYAAWNVWSSVSNRPLLPFKYQHIGDMMTLGRLDAAVALPVGGLVVDGPAAQALRRAAYLYRAPTDAHRAKIAGEWVKESASFALEEGPEILKKMGVPVPKEVESLAKELERIIRPK
jgi:NADH:ubiquinone reductase (non-electrogenic)